MPLLEIYFKIIHFSILNSYISSCVKEACFAIYLTPKIFMNFREQKFYILFWKYMNKMNHLILKAREKVQRME